MNQLRVAKKSLYEIEVNDRGDTISFNIEDPTLPLRLEKAYEETNKIADRCKKQLILIDKKEATKSKNAIMNNKEREKLQTYEKMYQDMRGAMDKFLGEGACQKIFGDVNYLTMYDELMEALQPHLEKMGLNANSFARSIEKKYGAKDETVLK